MLKMLLRAVRTVLMEFIGRFIKRYLVAQA